MSTQENPQNVRVVGTGRVFFVSLLTSALVSAATVIGLLRYGQPLLSTLPAPAAEVGAGDTAPAEVPELVGLRLDAAGELLLGRGLRPIVQERRPDAKAAEGTIVAQQPLAGSRLPLDSPVRVVVSEGPSGVPVPELVGRSEAEARGALEALGLSVGEVEAAEGTPGQVVGSEPAGGVRVEPGTAVTLQVGEPPRVIMPRLLGKHVRVAKQRLAKLGLTVGRVSEIYDRRKRGYVVLEQDPAPRSEVPEGTEVELIINQGD
ncbi:MAG: PASTA domain-containing protein [Myxococcales bacterium]|jgi:serine/threonine-protein kinase